VTRKLRYSRRRWKQAERELALVVGGCRVPVSGRARGDVPDIEHRWLSIEAKSWSAMPERVLDALRQAEAANVTGRKLPVALIHGNGERYERALVVLRLGDFMDWFGGGGQQANVPPSAPPGDAIGVEPEPR
jgi:hypothetical protein